MSGENQRTPRMVEIGHMEAHAGGTGVVVRVDGRETQRRSTVRSTEGEPTFTGRDDELGAIEHGLRDRRVVVLHGAPGLGKSRLAKEYAHKHVEGYLGGMFFVPFEQPPPTELAKLLRDTGKPVYAEESVEDQCRRALRDLGAAGRTLVIYDAVADERTLRDWLPYEGLDWHLIVTSTSANWASSWTTVEIGALRDEAARALVAAILADKAASDRLAEPIAAKAAGVTIELCASATAVHERLRRGRTVERVSAELARETMSSFEAAWTLLSRNAQVMLRVACAFATPRVPEPLLMPTLERLQWSATAAEDAVDEARERRLAAGAGNDVEVHQLVARFVREREPLGESMRRALFHGLIATATAFFEDPGNLDHRAWMLAYSVGLDDWADLITDWCEWTVLGHASIELGRFEAAQQWYERAASEAEKGDVYGRVNSDRLGTSLHQVGYCYSNLVKFEEALRWYERAVAAKERGDVRGCVDAASLGKSLHQVGACYSSLGKFEEALQWYERAVAAKEKGDVERCVEFQSLGTSLHQVGYCYARLGQFEEALRWYELAVASKERGDVRGRVNFASVGTSLSQVGASYWSLRQFEEALRWCERAVAAKGIGDMHGRVDSESLGRSLHHVGHCYANLGSFEEALRWFERAVAAKEKGDVHGRVDSASLGASLGQAGDCYAALGNIEEARRWHERAFVAKQTGDGHDGVAAARLGPGSASVGVDWE
jgi:tetratricopeptide (TPR) repeat protein